MDTPVTILCMKWGTMYGPEYVNHLREGVARHLKRPHRFVCFTDDATGLRPDVQALPLPGLGLPAGHGDKRWQKLALFRRDLAVRIGGFDQRHPYVIDLEYWLRLLGLGRGDYIDEALVAFRVWRGSWSVAIGTRQSAEFKALMADVQAEALAVGWDRWRGRVMPTVNALARQVFYRLFV